MPFRLCPRSLAAVAVALSLAPPLFAAEPLPPVQTVADARARLAFLDEQTGQVEAWVEKTWEAELPRRHPGLSLSPRGTGEAESAYRERQLRARMAVSDVKGALRTERREWLSRERRALLSREIREPLPVRLGPYDAERALYPVLLGFGWPGGLSIQFRVPEKESRNFEKTFPSAFPARYRINDRGEVLLLGLDKGNLKGTPVIYVPPAGPRMQWQGAHDSWVTSVAFRPDGGQVASAGADGAISVWDADSGNRIFRLGEAEMALSLAYAPDGSAFATAGADAVLRLRDASTGKEIWRSQGEAMMFSVSFSPDGRYVATGDDGGALRVWRSDTGLEAVRADLGSAVRAVAFVPGGRMIAAGTEGKSVVLWDMVSRSVSWRKELDGPVYAVAAGGPGGLVAAAGGGEKLWVLRISDGAEAWSRKTDGEVRTLRFDPEGRRLGSGGAGYTSGVFSAEAGEPLWSADIGSPVRSLDFGPSGYRLVVGSADFGVRLFDVVEGNRVVAAVGAYGRLYVDREKAADIFN